MSKENKPVVEIINGRPVVHGQEVVNVDEATSYAKAMLEAQLGRDKAAMSRNGNHYDKRRMNKNIEAEKEKLRELKFGD